jgi:CubicO group peptidase (beta-lactamase class C family)
MTVRPGPARIQDVVDRGFASIGAVGATVALVRGDRSWVFTRGEGRAGQRVTAATPFHVCSCSKTFTAAVFSRLVAEGAATWDAPIRDVLPELRFSDAAADNGCTFRDLATMRVGLARDGIAEWGIRQQLPREERLARARHMDFVAPFRSRFSYSNLCYIALSLAAERLAGQPYAQLVQDLICAPLGLSDTSSAGFGTLPPASAAIPHLPVAGATRGVRDLTGPNSEGSARIHLSGRDAIRWMRFLLDALGGSDAGPLSAAAVTAMATPFAPVTDPDVRMAPQDGAGCAYGMGLFVTMLHGRRLLRHGGGGRGWRHAMALAPEARAGVMVKESAESPAVEAWAMRQLHFIAGDAPSHWECAFARAATQAAHADRQRIESLFPADSAVPPLPLPAGCYADPVTGEVQLRVDASGAHLLPTDAPDFAAVLKPLGGAVYGLDFDEPALSPQPLDPPFRLRLAGTAAAPVLETSHFGRLRCLS